MSGTVTSDNFSEYSHHAKQFNTNMAEGERRNSWICHATMGINLIEAWILNKNANQKRSVELCGGSVDTIAVTSHSLL